MRLNATGSIPDVGRIIKKKRKKGKKNLVRCSFFMVFVPSFYFFGHSKHTKLVLWFPSACAVLSRAFLFSRSELEICGRYQGDALSPYQDRQPGMLLGEGLLDSLGEIMKRNRHENETPIIY